MNAEEFAQSFRDGIAAMTAGERRRAISYVQDAIRAALFDDATADRYEVECCPECGSVSIVRKGRSKSGEQRYLCKDCGRTFCAKTGSVLGTSKLPKETWMSYAECFVLMLPLRECARRCGVCLKTAYTMRHRLIEALSANTPAFKAGEGCGCEVDETYFPESFKGNHTLGSFRMPRPARKRGKQLHTRGLSREQICVMAGVNDAGEAFFDVVGRGKPTRAETMEALRGRVMAGAVVSTDGAAAYRSVLRELGVAGHRAAVSKSHSSVNRVNSLHSTLASFMARFRGVSTKHLAAYLDWFGWMRMFGYGGAETVARQMAGGRCRTRVRDMFGVEPPFMGYWEERNSALAV